MIIYSIGIWQNLSLFYCLKKREKEKLQLLLFLVRFFSFFLFWKLFDYTACLNYIDHWHYVLPPLFFFLLVVLVPLLKSIFYYSLNRQGIAHLTDDFVEQQCDSPVLNVDKEYDYWLYRRFPTPFDSSFPSFWEKCCKCGVVVALVHYLLKKLLRRNYVLLVTQSLVRVP